jgi:bacterioferritin
MHIKTYKNLLNIVTNESFMLEEFARDMIYQEELHLGEVDKMLRKPGDLSKFHA